MKEIFYSDPSHRRPSADVQLAPDRRDADGVDLHPKAGNFAGKRHRPSPGNVAPPDPGPDPRGPPRRVRLSNRFQAFRQSFDRTFAENRRRNDVRKSGGRFREGRWQRTPMDVSRRSPTR